MKTTPQQTSIPAATRAMLRAAASCLLAATLALATGCSSLFISKRKLPIPIAPATVQTASADELVEQLHRKWDKFESLRATVDIVASHLKVKEGEATDYPNFKAYLLLRKPEMIRILGKFPVIQTTMFDLASDGNRFTLWIPHNNTAYQGLSGSKGTSPVWYENLRPGFFFSAMVVRGLKDDEFYSVTSETVTEEDPADKSLLLHPEYVLNIQRRKAPESRELYPVRVVHFHREDLLPYEQDFYDDQGSLETQVIYGPYKDFVGVQFPSTITLRRLQENYALVMTVEQILSNPPLTYDQFQVKIPEGVAPREMK